MTNRNIICAENLKKRFVINGAVITAVDDVSIALKDGEVLGVIGKTGWRKSTLGKILLRLIEKDEGRVLIDGTDIYKLGGRRLARFRKDYQYIFQNPCNSLNPSKKVKDIVGEAAVYHGLSDGKDRFVLSILERCQLSEEFMERYPSQLSGGQCQRVAVARALAVKPRFIICDEITSALDDNSKDQIIDLIKETRKSSQLSVIYITHDTESLRGTDTVIKMESGRIVK